MRTDASPRGLYIHVPFCLSKCPYCDFYSVRYSRSQAELYADAVIRDLGRYGDMCFDTVYFGGGTPILLYEHTGRILRSADIREGAEITVEANPCMAEPRILEELRSAGVNRLSFGVQSMDARELSFLGRRHTVPQAENALINARKAGFDNVSADMMIGLPGQSEDTIDNTAGRLAKLGARHISAYILKIEENTPFAAQEIKLPDEDRIAELYLHTVNTLTELGFAQYEISNFAVPGYESRHNLKYWRCMEYLGIGASAHSYIDGRRFSVPGDIGEYISSPVSHTRITDENAGGWEEYAMLRLRLTEGVTFEEAARFGREERLRENAAKLPENLVRVTENGVRLTPEGFIVSNAVIGRLIF
ncbi:MAG: radical SAM family heme chaperone HemW [Ruminiclostridium sp.]|nr:radical SAM family heme chaperone HemW [Ruminiclostridium sp.]